MQAASPRIQPHSFDGATITLNNLFVDYKHLLIFFFLELGNDYHMLFYRLSIIT